MKKLFRITTVPISVEKLLGKQLTYMDQYFDVTAISADKEYLTRVGNELGIKTHAINMTRKITPIQDLKSLWEMYNYFKKEKPDIVHTHTPKAGLIGMVAAKLAGVKVRLHTVAGLPLMEATGIKRKILNQVEKFTYQCASYVYPNSNGLHDFIISERLGDSDKLKVIGNGSTNGIDVNYFDHHLYSETDKSKLKNLLDISADDFVFIFVGRLVGDKGINELVHAFCAFQQLKIKNAKLLLVGPLEQELDPLSPETLAEIDHNPDIISVGFQKDVRPYFAISNALVFPSYREGFPNVVLQALAMELPALVSDINGCNEIVSNDYNGIIFPRKNAQSVLHAMQLCANVEQYNRLQMVARSSVMKYKQEVVWDLLKKNYESLLIY